jgi:nucleoid DNA-binding protein
MKILEFVKSAKAANPKLLGDVQEKRAAKIVSTILGMIAKELDASPEGKVAIAGFGRFSIKQSEVEKEGKKVQKKRILFRRSSGKKKAEKGATGEKGGKGGKGKGEKAKLAAAAAATAATTTPAAPKA